MTPAQAKRVAEIKLAAATAGWPEPGTTGSILGQVTVIATNPDGGGQYTFTVDEMGKILGMQEVVAEALGY